MKRYEGKLAGIIGTIIIHLLVGIMFFTVKLYSLRLDLEKEYILVLEESEDQTAEEDISLPADDPAGKPDIDMMIRNIARNLANQENPVLDPAEYQDRVKEEMIKTGLLTEDNFIDDWKKKISEEIATIPAEPKKELSGEDKEEREPENYQGPTRVYYNLTGRYHRHLPVPVYKCKGEGKVTVEIDVDQNGNVTAARIVASGSSTKDLCLIETAVNSSLASKFNINPASPKNQTGTITFHFVSQ
jgi:TonB family protein